MSDQRDFVYYDHRTNNWRHTTTGRFVSAADIRAEFERHVDHGVGIVQQLTRQLFAKQIDAQRWGVAVASELKSMHGSMAMFGAGGRGNMDQSAWGKVGAAFKRQLGFLNKFVDLLSGGKLSEAQALARISQYAKASGQQFWLQRADQFNYGSNLPVLRQVPQDGHTRCRGHCNCELVFTSKGIRWVTHEGENCPDCERLAAGGPYRME